MTAVATETERRSVSGAEIRLENVTKRYPNTKAAAVDDFSMVIPAGQIVVFVGPSGCGKTTTMRMINRMVEPTSGVITIDGRDALHIDADELRRGIGYAIQQAGLFPHFTVAQNIAVVPGLLKWDKKKIDARVEEMMDLVGLDPATFRDRLPRQLSGGQQQRVGVARALAADPPVLLMDEPFGAVDPITRGNLQDELLRLQNELGKTIVFVTHDFDEAVKLGDRIAVLGDRSTIQQYDTPDAILANPANDTVAGFVGAGASLKQLTLLRVRDVELRTDTLTVDHGDAPAQVAERLRQAGATYALVLDDRQRPLRWVHQRELTGRTSLAEVGKPVGDAVSTQSTLHDALEAILVEGGGAAVTGARGEFVGTIDIATVTEAIAAVRETHADRGAAMTVIAEGLPGVSRTSAVDRPTSVGARSERARLFFEPIAVVVIVGAVLVWALSSDLNANEQETLNLPTILTLTGQHVLITLLVSVLVVVIAVPLGIALTRPGLDRLAPLFLAIANLGQAAPALGVIVLFFLWSGVEGLWAVVVPLVFYTLLPVLRNTMVGIQQVDPSLIDAGRGIGMSAAGVLWRVELPLAVPLILAGLRTALVLAVGTATLAFFVNGGGLGELIDTGYKLQLNSVMYVGAALAIGLALLVDWLGGVAEQWLAPKGAA